MKDIDALGSFRLMTAVFASSFKDAPELTAKHDKKSYLQAIEKHCKLIEELSENNHLLELFCDCSDNFESKRLSNLLKKKAIEIREQALLKIEL